MRRLLLLAALCMMALAVFAPAALAQRSNAETQRIENPRNCDEFGGSQAAAQDFLENVTPQDEFNLDADDDGIACEELGGGSTASPTASASASPTAEDVDCETGFISAAGNPSQFGAQQFFDFNATPAQQAALDADGDGFACDDLETGVDNLGETDADRASASASAPATSSASASALPDTGGAVSPAALSLVAALLLVGGGIMSASIARRK